MSRNKQHGGARDGSGRPPSPYGPTKTVKIPARWEQAFNDWLDARKRQFDNTRKPR